ncbi:MAG: NADPH-dependent FMN reductase [Micavibrio aeruginosavorus]|uniref:NADPH-dependent FMN reductase n=1 Tax=Micavibrio aeruginosavorus TaxID=349221 RepID=A0A2W5MVU6_9BACT|nr:MAG: NADPH-dependent FMN reductase [Micavibrio aeruginosavorus]
MSKNIKTAVVYHSGYGHNEVIAKAVERGAKKAGETALIKISPEGKIEDGEWETLNAADAIVFGAPTYMGSASGPFKMFADASSKAWFTQNWKDKVAGGFTTSHSMSGDKLNTLQQLSILAAQHGMIWASVGVPGAQQTGDAHQRNPEEMNRLGSFLGVMAQAENVAAEQSPPSGDVKTAESYGERVANIAKKLKAA